MGAQEGTSSDIYTYSVKTAKVTRLTTRPTDVAHLKWSPDGKYIIYQDVLRSKTVDDWGIPELWAVRSDGTAARILYKAKLPVEDIVGWVDARTYLSINYDLGGCNYNAVFSVNIETGLKRQLTAGCAVLPIYDPKVRLVYFSVEQSYYGPNYGNKNIWEPGLYTLGLSGAVRRITNDSLSPALYSPQLAQIIFFIEHNQYGLVSSAGKITTRFSLDGIPLISPNAKYWAWSAYSDGVSGGLVITEPQGTNPLEILGKQEYASLLVWVS